MTTLEKIRGKLTTELAPTKLEVSDDSHQHAGHEGAKSGGGHYTVEIESAAFAGLNLVQRHQLIYRALGDMMIQEIHALAIKSARSPL